MRCISEWIHIGQRHIHTFQTNSTLTGFGQNIRESLLLNQSGCFKMPEHGSQLFPMQISVQVDFPYTINSKYPRLNREHYIVRQVLNVCPSSFVKIKKSNIFVHQNQIIDLYLSSAEGKMIWMTISLSI